MTSTDAPDAGPTAPRSFEATRAHGAAIVGHIAVRDPDGWAAYVAAVPATLVPWRAELVLRGEQRLPLSGTQVGNDLVVIRFPDLAAIEAWYRSDAYRALIPMRDAAADVVLAAYAIEPPPPGR